MSRPSILKDLPDKPRSSCAFCRVKNRWYYEDKQWKCSNCKTSFVDGKANLTKQKLSRARKLGCNVENVKYIPPERRVLDMDKIYIALKSAGCLKPP